MAQRNYTKAIAGLLAATMGSAGSALAADRFEGVYLGGELNYSAMDADYEDAAGAIEGLSISGPGAGAIIGTGLARGSIFFGLEASIGFSDADHQFTNGANRIDVNADETYGLTARFGHVVSESTLLYALGGYRSTRFEQQVTTGAGTSSSDEDAGGVRLGGGVEFVNEARNFIRFEYSVTQYSEIEDNDAGFEYEPRDHQLGVAAGYRF